VSTSSSTFAAKRRLNLNPNLNPNLNLNLNLNLVLNLVLNLNLNPRREAATLPSQ